MCRASSGVCTPAFRFGVLISTAARSRAEARRRKGQFRFPSSFLYRRVRLLTLAFCSGIFFECLFSTQGAHQHGPGVARDGRVFVADGEDEEDEDARAQYLGEEGAGAEPGFLLDVPLVGVHRACARL